jgi:hypothetical protein
MDAFSLFTKGDVVGERTQTDLLPISGANVAKPSEPLGASAPPSSVPVITVNNPLQTLIKTHNVDTTGKIRVMLCGTYPIGQSNGYSRVVYYIAKHLGLKKDIALTVYGFQNYQQTSGSQIRNEIPSDVILHDALAKGSRAIPTQEPARYCGHLQ